MSTATELEALQKELLQALDYVDVVARDAQIVRNLVTGCLARTALALQDCTKTAGTRTPVPASPPATTIVPPSRSGGPAALLPSDEIEAAVSSLGPHALPECSSCVDTGIIAAAGHNIAYCSCDAGRQLVRSIPAGRLARGYRP